MSASRHRKPYTAAVLVIVVAAWCCGVWSNGARADVFRAVRYDAQDDQLVITVAYRGTNAHHQFDVRWGKCRERGGTPGHVVAAAVVDHQWDDPAKQPFVVTRRIGLAAIADCRPVRAELRIAPGFLASVTVPRAPAR